jgi:hypothetical protein
MTVADEALKGGNGGNFAYVPGPVVGGEGEYAECPMCDAEGSIPPALGITVAIEASNGGNVEYVPDLVVGSEYDGCPMGKLDGRIGLALDPNCS